MRFKCDKCGFSIRIPDGAIAEGTPITCPCGGHGQATATDDDVKVRPRPVLTTEEQAELFPDVTDPTLLGERVAALTAALGIPHCGGCERRKKWLNKAHEWLRGKAGCSKSQ